MEKTLKKHFLVAMMLLLAGAVLGTAMGLNANAQIASYLKEEINNALEAAVPGTAKLFSAGALENLKYVVCGAVLCQSIYLFPIYTLLYTAKGFSLGLCIAFTIKNCTGRALWIMLLSAGISAVLIYPLYVILFCVYLNYAMYTRRSKTGRKKGKTIKLVLVSSIIYVTIVAGVFLEAILNPLLGKI